MSAFARRTDVAAGIQAASGDRAVSVALVASTVCVTSQAYC